MNSEKLGKADTRNSPPLFRREHSLSCVPKEKRKKIVQETGVRIVKSLFFWGMTAVLASSAYTDIQKIAGQESVAEANKVHEARTARAVTDQNGTAKTVQTEQYRDSTVENAVADHESPDLVQKKVALTFDDGPHKVYTEQLLDGLAQRHIAATFFVIGKNIEGNEALLERMQEEGHLIGNHTYDHVKICDMDGDSACEQVEKTSALVKAITGEDTEFVRPPFGAWNKAMECSFTMIPVLWDVDPLDWTTQNSAAVVQKVLDTVEENDIILLHDCYQSSVDAALIIADELQAQGYEFVTVDELILE